MLVNMVLLGCMANGMLPLLRHAKTVAQDGRVAPAGHDMRLRSINQGRKSRKR